MLDEHQQPSRVLISQEKLSKIRLIDQTIPKGL